MDYYKKWSAGLKEEENEENRLEQNRKKIYTDKPWLKPEPLKTAQDFIGEGIKSIPQVLIKEVPKKAKLFWQGLKRATLSTPQVVGGLTKEFGETTKQEKETELWKLFFTPTMMEEAKSLWAKGSKVDEKAVKLGTKIIKENKEYIDSLNLDIEAKTTVDKIVAGLGSAIPSIGLSVGVGLLTKSPTLSATAFGLMAKGMSYEEYREAGVEPQMASLFSSGRGLTEGLLEGIGLNFILRRYSSPLLGMVARHMTEFVQEYTQEVGENFWAKLAYDDQRGLFENAFMSGIIGFIAAVPVNIMVESVYGRNIKKTLLDSGIDNKTATKMTKDIIEKSYSGVENTAEKDILDTIENEMDSATIEEILASPEKTYTEMDEQIASILTELGQEQKPEILPYAIQEEAVKEVKPEAISKELEPLAVEARKYKSAEEFSTSIKNDINRVLSRYGSEVDYVKVVGSTARGKISPNDLDIIINPTNKIKELGYISSIKDDLIFSKTEKNIKKEIENNLNKYFDLKIHITFAEKIKGKPSLELTDIYNQAVEEVKPELLSAKERKEQSQIEKRLGKEPYGNKKVGIKKDITESIKGKDEVVTAKEKTLLNTRIRAIQKGIKMGRADMRKDMIELIKERKAEIKDIKDTLYAYIKQVIPVKYRGKFLGRMKNVNTRLELSKTFRAVDQEQLRILKKDLLTEIKKNIDQIKKLHPVEQLKVGQLLDNIRIVNISDNEMTKINELKDFIKENKEVIQVLGRKNIKRVDYFKETEKEGLKEISVPELLELRDILVPKITEAKKITAERKAVHKQKIENKIDQLSKIILKGKTLVPKWISKVKEKWTRAKKVELSLVRPNYLFDQFDHSPKMFGTGENYNTLYKPLATASAKTRVNLQLEKANFRELCKKNNIKINDAHNIKIINGQELSLTERLDIVLRSKDPYQLEIQKRNGYTTELIENVENSLSKDELGLVDWAINYYKRKGKSLAKVAIDVDEKLIPLTEGYNPVNYVYEEKVDEEQELADIIFRSEFKPSVPEAGMIKARTGKVSDLKYDFFGNLNDNIGRFEHYIAMRPAYHETRDIIFSKKWAQSVTQEFGSHYYDQAKRWWQNTVSRKQEHLDLLNKFSEGLRRNFVRSVLAFPRMTTAFKQAISTSTAAAQIGGKWAMLGWQENIKNHSEVEALFSESEILKDRIGKFNRDIENMSERKAKQLFGNNWKEVLDKQMAVIRFIDKQTVYAVAMGSYMKMMKESNNNHAKSLLYAEDIVASTQPMATIETLSPILAYKGFSRWLTMFNNQLNQNYNIWRRWALRMKEGKATTSETLHLAAYHWLIPMLILRAISVGIFPWDKKEKFFDLKGMILDLVLYPIQSVIIVGRIINSIAKGYPIEPMAFNQLFGEAGYFIKSKSDEKRLKHGLSFLGLLLGIGLDQTRNSVEDINKFLDGGFKSSYDGFIDIDLPDLPDIDLSDFPDLPDLPDF